MAKFAYKDDEQKFAFEDFFGLRLCDCRNFMCRLLHSPGCNRPSRMPSVSSPSGVLL
jgi:hypothetical protein